MDAATRDLGLRQAYSELVHHVEHIVAKEKGALRSSNSVRVENEAGGPATPLAASN